jgi:hypothetical protein
MARALECPACGARHRIESLPDAPTFRCEQCGQVLKVPSAVSSDPGAPAPPPRAGGSTPVAPPRRRAPDEGTDASPTRVAPAAAAVSATVAATAPDERGDARRNGHQGPTPAKAPAKAKRVAWYWRLLAWIVAVPVAFFLTAWPAYEFGFISKDDLLDIFVGTGVGRYLRLGIVTFAWALVTALLVQIFVEGGRVRAARRRRARAAAA